MTIIQFTSTIIKRFISLANLKCVCIKDRELAVKATAKLRICSVFARFQANFLINLAHTKIEFTSVMFLAINILLLTFVDYF